MRWQNTIMKFCFILGTVQLSLACVMNIRRKLKEKDLSWIADLGWLATIDALYFVVLYLVIGFYPALAGSLGAGGSITEQAWAMLGQSVILLVAVFMSGKFTKAITNAMA